MIMVECCLPEDVNAANANYIDDVTNEIIRSLNILFDINVPANNNQTHSIMVLSQSLSIVDARS